MTDLLHTISDFPIKHYTHLLPSLEKNLITTTDLLTLDALDVAKRAQLPLLEVRRLKEHVLAVLQGQLGLPSELSSKFDNVGQGSLGYGALKKDGLEIAKPRGSISTLDPTLDEALGGGIQTGYITEITGESGAGKTQLLLTLLLSAQLPISTSRMSNPSGLGRSTCYISTEHALPTSRVQQILRTNLFLSKSDTPPSLSKILTLQTPDLESQDHILTYQLPIALARHNIGLIVLDSITANYRAEPNNPAGLATRSAQLVKLGSLLRNLAREHDCAIVVANQVSDRFSIPPVPTSASKTSYNAVAGPRPPPTAGSNVLLSLSPASSTLTSTPTPSHTTIKTNLAPLAILSLDHQQRFFTGWGDSPPNHPSHPHSTSSTPHNTTEHNLKTPSLGLVWANQIASRIALIKEEAVATTTTAVTSSYHHHNNNCNSNNDDHRAGIITTSESALTGTGGGGAGESTAAAEWTPKKWRRWMRVVFAPWVAGCGEGDRGVEFEVWGGGVRAIMVGGKGERSEGNKKRVSE